MGPYRLLSKLGGGGMGSVYLALHPHLDRLVAVKLLAPRYSGNPNAVARFKQEMTACGRLRHPHIIAATDAGEEDGHPYLVMEFVKGIDLSHLLRQRGPLSVADACELARQVAEGLACIGRNGMVHRDIKPSNLLLGEDGVLRILDLGLARLERTPDDHEPLTETGQVMGTGDFIAPEQGLQSRDVDIRADIYSLGCTLYALLAGAPPFARPAFDTFYHKIRAHLEEPVPSLRQRRPDVPAELDDLLARMLAKSPGERVASPAEVAAQLAPFTPGHDVPALLAGLVVEPDTADAPAPAQTPPRRVAERTTIAETGQEELTLPQRRPRRRWALAGVLAVLAVLASGLAGWLALRDAPRRDAWEPGRPALKPGDWTDLLAGPPRKLVWPEDSPTARCTHDPEKRKLWLACDDLGLLQLAQAPEPGFELEVKLLQNVWVGGVGVFFRGREPPEAGTGLWGDLLLLQRFEHREDKAPANLTRGFLRRHPGRDRPFLDLVRSQKVKRPQSGEHTLTVRVGPEGIEAVLWDGEAAERLQDPQPEVAARAGAGGAIGIFIQDSNAVISSARIRVRPPP